MRSIQAKQRCEMLKSMTMVVLLASTTLFAGGCCVMDSMSACGRGRYRVDDACRACGGVGCGRCRIVRRLDRVRAARCARGCGEVYRGEWTNYPPDFRDPCNDCGNWNGSRWAPPFLLARWRSLWGYRRYRTYKGSCCNSCGGPMVYMGPVQKEVEIVPAPKTNTRTRVIESKSAVKNPRWQYYRSHQNRGRTVVH